MIIINSLVNWLWNGMCLATGSAGQQQLLQDTLPGGVYYFSHSGKGGQRASWSRLKQFVRAGHMQALALIELHRAPKGLYKNEVYLLPKKMGKGSPVQKTLLYHRHSC